MEPKSIELSQDQQNLLNDLIKGKSRFVTGKAGSGKTTVLNALKDKNFYCFDEVSRAVTLKAQ